MYSLNPTALGLKLVLLISLLNIAYAQPLTSSQGNPASTETAALDSTASVSSSAGVWHPGQMLADLALPLPFMGSDTPKLQPSSMPEKTTPLITKQIELTPKHSPTKGQQLLIAGGYNEIDITTPGAVRAAQFAVKAMNKGELGGIMRAHKQVVAGLNYKLLLRLVTGQVYEVVVYQNLQEKLELSSVKAMDNN